MRSTRLRQRYHPRNSKTIVTRSDRYDNTKYFIDNGIDIENRRIMLDDEVDEVSVGMIIRALRRMIDADKSRPIDIYINSYGGSVYDGLALYDFIRACSYTTIRTHAFGKIMSIAAIIYLAGDERYSSPHATFMCHETSDEGIKERLHQSKTDVKELERLNKILIEILTDRASKRDGFWQRELKYEDRYYDKKKALALGIVTESKFEVE